MVDTFTVGKAHLTKQSTGSNTGAWGPILNTNEDNTDVVTSGIQAITVSASNYILSTSEARAAVLKINGTISAGLNVVFPNGVTGIWQVWNNTSGAFTITLITAAPGVSVTAAQGTFTTILSDGTDIRIFVQSYSANLTAWAAKTAPSGTVVGTSDAQVITNKSIIASQLTSGTFAAGVGFAATSYAKGVVTSGTYTPLYSDGNFQDYTNNGPHTLAPPADICSIIVECVNGASAGAITTSGFTDVGGDTLNTTNGNKFQFTLVKSKNYSSLTVRALQ